MITCRYHVKVGQISAAGHGIVTGKGGDKIIVKIEFEFIFHRDRGEITSTAESSCGIK